MGIPEKGIFPVTTAIRVTEIEVILSILRLSDTGHPDRLRTCAHEPCSRWMFKRFEHQSFCGRKCQQNAYQSTPKFKEHRRRWERDYYWNQYAKLK